MGKPALRHISLGKHTIGSRQRTLHTYGVRPLQSETKLIDRGSEKCHPLLLRSQRYPWGRQRSQQ